MVKKYRPKTRSRYIAIPIETNLYLVTVYEILIYHLMLTKRCILPVPVYLVCNYVGKECSSENLI